MSSKNFPRRTQAGKEPAVKDLGKKRLLRVFQGAVLAIFTLLGIALYFGYSSSQTLKQTIREQYNEQQFFLTGSTANMLQSNLQSALSDLILLNSMPAIQYAEPEAYETLLIAVLPVLKRDNISQLRRVNRHGQVLFTADESGIFSNQSALVEREAAAFLSWAGDPSKRGRVMITGVRRQSSISHDRLFMDMIIPTYEESFTEHQPRPTHRFSGYLRSTLDVNSLMRKVVPNIRSGETGYAWVMDSFGLILHHPEALFVGTNAFSPVQENAGTVGAVHEFRQEIRDIVQHGREGTGTYFFNHPDDPTRKVEKLIALSPVVIQSPFTDLVWSVAVSVPVEEIEGNISLLYQKQILFQGVIFLIILICAGVVVIYQLRWSTILEHEVDQKTQHIQNYASELKRSETKYRTLVESAEDLIFTVDSRGVIKTANQHMQRIFNLKRDNHISGVFPHHEAGKQLEIIKEVIGKGKGRSEEVQLWTENSEHWFNIQYMPLREQETKLPLALGIARDITDRKIMDMQLINTEKLASLGTMAAGVAHEINNPLGIILGYCELLQEKTDPGTEEYKDIKTIEKKGLHCKAIVESLLSFARISEEKDELCDINANINEILNMIRHSLDKHHIRIITRLAPEHPYVRGDSRRIQQVILNFITNSIYSMQENGGTLTITTRIEKSMNMVLLTISDTGSGISKEIMDKIFDPFFTTKKVGEGTGLGLSVSYGIVSGYGGSITCRSFTSKERPAGHGTIFSILLPIARNNTPDLPGSGHSVN
jgi:two-component system, NtrC family, sensor kinase